MRASPAFQLTIRRFGVWRAAIAVLLLAAVTSLFAFAFAKGDSAPAALRAMGLAASVAIVLAGATLMRCQPVSLRWDTQRWNLGPASSVGEEPWPGRLEVAIDLGAWMLLRFEHDFTPELGRTGRTRWLPVQRRGLEPAWHALRCAVYSARPDQGLDSDQRLGVSPE
jgi:hypothetical protein